MDRKLPSALEHRFEQVLEGPEDRYEDEVAALAREHPEHAATIWRWLAVVREPSELPRTEPSPALALGHPKTVGPYRILSRLGQGGMGSVYLAEHAKVGRRAAVKMIRADLLEQDDVRTRFAREMKALAKLEVPGICRVFEVGEEQGVPFMAMQLIDGEDLGQKLRRARRDEPEPTSIAVADEPAGDRVHAVVEFGEKLARTLHAAHETGLVHRDIKPENVMVTPGGEPVVLDFGLARDLSSSHGATSRSCDRAGTAAYMAPEQVATGRAAIDRRADVYAVGVVLYECLTLRRPLVGRTRHELFQAIVETEPTRADHVNPSVPKDLAIILAKAMDKDAERRYPSALELAEDLRRYRAKEPILARPAGLALRIERWTRRNPIAAFGIAAASITLIVAVWLLHAREVALAGEKALRREELRQKRRAQDYLETGRLLANFLDLHEAKKTAATLYPAWPRMLPRLREWLRERGEPLARRLPELRERLRVAQRSRQDRFRQDTLVELVDELTKFANTDDGALARVRRDVAWAETVTGKSIDSYRARWRDAITAIAASDGVRASKLYGGMTLAPQVGLVPLGMDPRSKLWEFGHIRSGALPEREPYTGRLRIAEDTGLVFVLVPGGTFYIGAQNQDPGRPNYDPDADASQAPVTEVTLGPFFLCKYEMTQAQWARLRRGEQPSTLQVESEPGGDEAQLGLHPVESVSWRMCDQLLRLHGLVLPTEAQWEYACRAGTSSPWWTGAKPAPDAVKFAEDVRSLPRIDGEPEPPAPAPPAHVAVNTMLANAFGFHHMAGNVREWCRDHYFDYRMGFAPGDGLLGGGEPGSPERSVRGGDFGSEAGACRSACRRPWFERSRAPNVGVRPARALEVGQ